MLDLLLFPKKEADVGLNSYVVIVILLMTVALPFVRGKASLPLADNVEAKPASKFRTLYENLLLLACTIAVVIFFGQLWKGDARPAKVQSAVSEDRAESALRIMSTINVGVARLSETFGELRDDKGKRHHAIEVRNASLSSYFKTAAGALQDALKRNPDDASLKAKLVVLLSVWDKQAAQAKSTCSQLKDAKASADRKLGEVLWATFIEHSAVSPSANDQDLKIIDTGIQKGWYQDNAKLSVYKQSKDQKDFASFSKELEDRYYKTFCIFIAAVVVGTICAFAGVVVIVIQMGSLGRREALLLPEDERIGLDLSYRTIYAVFVGWMASQLAIEECFKLLPKNSLSLGGNPFGIALFSLVSYLITMAPGIALIYLLALRPKGLSLIKGMKLRLRTQTMGPFRLMLAGFLSWCAIIPMVLMSSVIASALGSQGSDNPILPQIAAIASSQNFAAIFILYATVAAMAPLCEEMIFRGFLYASLRTRLGIFPAVLLSALIFAGIHFDKGGALMLCALGPVLALAFEKTRSLVPSMIAHGLWNGGAFAVTLSLYFS